MNSMFDDFGNHPDAQMRTCSSTGAAESAPPRRHHAAAAAALFAIAASVALWPTAASSKPIPAQAGARIAKSATAKPSATPATGIAPTTPATTPAPTDTGGTGPGTTPPPVIGSPPMDPVTGWVFPIREANQMAGVSSWTLDQGVDLGFGAGFSTSFCGPKATLVAVEDGVITTVGLNGFGPQSPVLKITRGPYKGRQVYYGHSQPTIVKKGDVVKRGQAISHIGCGIVGSSSAPHLEFGLYAKGATYCCPSQGVTSNEVYSILRRMWPVAVIASKKLRAAPR